MTRRRHLVVGRLLITLAAWHRELILRLAGTRLLVTAPEICDLENGSAPGFMSTVLVSPRWGRYAPLRDLAGPFPLPFTRKHRCVFPVTGLQRSRKVLQVPHFFLECVTT
jgi:hypothetical protein